MCICMIMRSEATAVRRCTCLARDERQWTLKKLLHCIYTTQIRAQDNKHAWSGARVGSGRGFLCEPGRYVRDATCAALQATKERRVRNPCGAKRAGSTRRDRSLHFKAVHVSLLPAAVAHFVQRATRIFGDGAKRAKKPRQQQLDGQQRGTEVRGLIEATRMVPSCSHAPSKAQRDGTRRNECAPSRRSHGLPSLSLRKQDQARSHVEGPNNKSDKAGDARTKRRRQELNAK